MRTVWCIEGGKLLGSLYCMSLVVVVDLDGGAFKRFGGIIGERSSKSRAIPRIMSIGFVSCLGLAGSS